MSRRFTALFGMPWLQLVAALGWLFFSLFFSGAFVSVASAQENSEIPPEWLFSDEVVDLAEEEDDTPKFVVPPDPKIPYLDAIDRFEEDYGPYATELSDLYLGLGEVFMKDGEYEDALDAYHRGVMVVRVNAGPNSPEQTNLLYLIANVETLLDEPKRADKILDNIRFINEQYYGEHSAELYPVYEGVYDWYATARPLDVDESEYRDYLQIIDITEDMVGISENTNGLTVQQAARAYRRMAEAHFEAMRFAMAEDDWVDPRIIVASDVPYRVTPGYEDLSMREHYKEGRDAFKQYIEIIRTDPTRTQLEYAEALADLADWSLHFQKYRAARTLYEEAYQVLAQSPEYSGLIDEYLGQPQPMEFTGLQVPSIVDAPIVDGSMRINVSMTVTRIGDVRYVEVLDPPENLTSKDITKISRDVQDTPFRPSLKDGKAVTTEGFIWQHEYYPEPEEESSTEEISS